MLALITYSLSTIFMGGLLYRIGAGCCSIIGLRAYQSLILDNRQRPRYFYARS